VEEKTRRVIQSLTPHTGTIKLRSAHRDHSIFSRAKARFLVISLKFVSIFAISRSLSHASLSFSLMTVVWWITGCLECTTSRVISYLTGLTN